MYHPSCGARIITTYYPKNETRMLHTIPQRVPVYARNMDTAGTNRKETLVRGWGGGWGGFENGSLRLRSGDVGITLAQGRIRESSG